MSKIIIPTGIELIDLVNNGNIFAIIVALSWIERRIQMVGVIF